MEKGEKEKKLVARTAFEDILTSHYKDFHYQKRLSFEYQRKSLVDLKKMKGVLRLCRARLDRTICAYENLMQLVIRHDF